MIFSKLGRFDTATNDKLPLNCIKGAKKWQ
nr:MAG TPA: hypothetical protein [Caudoviricetes sp.]DAW81559.1 MAG TPA: hypothetical protein [Caudoviricetes sp.]DAX31291.1 MAG TPA: hypothetical protein [Caudoviricetes sp.]